MRHVFIIGSRGLPAKYGGFETFVAELVKHQLSQDIQYHVACLSDKDHHRHFTYENVDCFTIKAPKLGPARVIAYDMMAIQYALSIVERDQIKKPIFYILGNTIGAFIAPFARNIKKAGGLFYINPDGLEWKRSKWSKPIQTYLKYAEKCMTKSADLVVSDNVGIENYIKNTYERVFLFFPKKKNHYRIPCQIINIFSQEYTAMSIRRTKFWVLSSVAAVMMLTGCSKQEAEQAVTLNIGYQKYGMLPILKERGVLETALKKQNVSVKWVEFPAGPQLLEGLNVGSVVFGESGEAPPIFAQAANSNLVYVANQPAAPKAEALIVQKDSKIQSVADLKGKRVVLNKGSNVHYLLLKVLEANHLTLKDIQVVYLPPADARAAFEKGAVDAWVIWDPFFAAAQQQLGARVLSTGQNLVSNHQFYLADRKFAQNNPQVFIVKSL